MENLSLWVENNLTRRNFEQSEILSTKYAYFSYFFFHHKPFSSATVRMRKKKMRIRNISLGFSLALCASFSLEFFIFLSRRFQFLSFCIFRRFHFCLNFTLSHSHNCADYFASICDKVVINFLYFACLWLDIFSFSFVRESNATYAPTTRFDCGIWRIECRKILQ